MSIKTSSTRTPTIKFVMDPKVAFPDRHAPTTALTSLCDIDLTEIFKRLPAYDRLRVSTVCRRWRAISQHSWNDVTHLELDTSVPPQYVGAIVRKCPKLRSLFCKDQVLILDELRSIVPASPLQSVAYQRCSFISRDDAANETTLPLFRSIHGQSVEELVLHQHAYGVEPDLSKRYSQRLLPFSLKRLQMSGMNTTHWHDINVAEMQEFYFIELAKLSSLECLLIHAKSYYPNTSANTTIALRTLRGLRELSLNVEYGTRMFYERAIYRITSGMHKLEVLVLPENIPAVAVAIESVMWRSVFLKCLMLRILVIPGTLQINKQKIRIPLRKRFPHGVAAVPLPLLHVFVSKNAAALFRFDDSPANWMRVHPINAPFPQMLEREEIAEIFGDSWIAKQIREGAKRNINFWNYNGNLVDDA